MKPIRTLGLAAGVALVAMACLGTSSASAIFDTSLCTQDTADLSCPFEPLTVHYEDKTSVLKTTTPALTITCEGLLEGQSLFLASPLVLHVGVGGLTYSKCDKGCTLKNEVTGLVLILKIGKEETLVFGDNFRVRLICGKLLDCKYNWTGLEGHGFGALAVAPNGVIWTTEAPLTKEGGGACPATAKLTVELIPSLPLYIRS